MKAKDEANLDGEVVQTYEELVASYGKLPNTLISFAPIVVPILLMALSSALSMAGISSALFTFLGTPIIAIGVGVVLALFPLAGQKKLGEFRELTNQTLEVTGPILSLPPPVVCLGILLLPLRWLILLRKTSGPSLR